MTWLALGKGAPRPQHPCTPRGTRRSSMWEAAGAYVPVQRGHVLVAGHVVAALADAVPQHELGGRPVAALVQVPDPRRRVSGPAEGSAPQSATRVLTGFLPFPTMQPASGPAADGQRQATAPGQAARGRGP